MIVDLFRLHHVRVEDDDDSPVAVIDERERRHRSRFDAEHVLSRSGLPRRTGAPDPPSSDALMSARLSPGRDGQRDPPLGVLPGSSKRFLQCRPGISCFQSRPSLHGKDRGVLDGRMGDAEAVQIVEKRLRNGHAAPGNSVGQPHSGWFRSRHGPGPGGHVPARTARIRAGRYRRT